MCFKRFHTWAEFLPLTVFLPTCAFTPMSRTNSHKSCDPTGPEDSESTLAKIISSHRCCEEVNLPLNCKLSPPFTPLSCLIRSSPRLVVCAGFGRHKQQNKMLYFLTHSQLKKAPRRTAVSVPLPVPSPPRDLNQIQCYTWGTGTIKSTNRQMPGCSALSAPVWQSVPLVITASWLGSLNIHLPSARSSSNSAQPAAALFTCRLLMHPFFLCIPVFSYSH